MTTVNPDAANAQTLCQAEGPDVAGTIKPGIYLEEKKSVIGTGGTAKTAEYRTFWVTLAVTQTTVSMVLLDDDFKPTAVKENFAHEIISGPNWYYIAEGEKRYQRLRPYLDRLLTPPAPAAKPEAKTSGNWWDGGGTSSSISAKKKPTATNTKKNWWG